MGKDRPAQPGRGAGVRLEKAEVRVIASAKNWIEGAAVQQLEKTAELEGMRLAVGLPDLHPGRGTPIGAAYVVEGHVYPTLVGNDVGCGIGLWQTSLDGAEARPNGLTGKLKRLEGAWEGDVQAWLREHALEPTGFEEALGTVGGGNHFAELQRVESVDDSAALAAANVDPGALFLLVHSGSRGFGESILRRHVERFGAAGLPADSTDGLEYRATHETGVRWASANRGLIAERLLACLGAEGRRVLDVCHNWVELRAFEGGERWLHRKGAAPSTEGLVVIPGSRGSFSYLVEPLNPTERSAFSLAHGAGRKWSRSDSRARLEKRYSPRDLLRTELGSAVICEDKALLYEEAPQAYKKIGPVIEDLVDAGLVRVVAVLRPVVTYKTRRSE